MSTDWVLGKSENQQIVEQPKVENVQPNSLIKGYCEKCNKPVRAGEYVVERGFDNLQIILCKECKQETDKEKHETEVHNHGKTIKKGFLWGGIVGVASLLFFTICCIVSKEYIGILGGIVLSVMAFTFTTQMIWDRSVNDCYWFFQKSFRMPGLIFELSLDGLIWFICVKLLFGVISWLLSAICYLVGLAVCFVYSVIAFPFATINIFREYKKI